MGTEVERYTFTVKYTPETTGADTTYPHTTPNGESGLITNGTGDNEVKSENAHIIIVIAKGFELTKADENNMPITGKTASFKLYRKLKAEETGVRPLRWAEFPFL